MEVEFFFEEQLYRRSAFETLECFTESNFGRFAAFL